MNRRLSTPLTSTIAVAIMAYLIASALMVCDAIVIFSPSSNNTLRPVLINDTKRSTNNKRQRTTTTPTTTRQKSSSSRNKLGSNSKKTSSITNNNNYPPPPTPEEERELLHQVTEYRRLRSIQSDLDLHSSTKKTILPSTLAHASGYGHDIDQYTQALSSGYQAREDMITRNMGLVHHVIYELCQTRTLNSLSYEDLIQEGAIGLSRAVDRYDVEMSRGGRFATYAVYWIRATALRCIAERDEMVRVPEHMATAINKMIKAAQTLGMDLSSSSTDDLFRGRAWKEAADAKALAEEAGLTPDQLHEAARVNARRKAGYAPFEPWMLSSSSSSSSGEEEVEERADMDYVREILSKFLVPKEVEAISWRYGLLRDDKESDSVGITTITTTTTGDNTEEAMSVPPRQFRDYLAEAEEDLFGPNGIMSSYQEDDMSSPVSIHRLNKSSSSSTITRRRRTVSSQKASPVKNAGKRRTRTSAGGIGGGRWGEAMSFAEVGKHMAVSAEYGRKLCSRALEKLRAAAEDGRLEPEFLI